MKRLFCLGKRLNGHTKTTIHFTTPMLEGIAETLYFMQVFCAFCLVIECCLLLFYFNVTC